MSNPENAPESPEATPPVGDVAAPDLVLTPGGWRPRSEVHRLERGHHVSGKSGRLRIVETATGNVIRDLGVVTQKKRPRLRRKPRSRLAAAIDDAGWIEYAYWQNTTGAPIVRFASSWQVPPAPADDDGQTLFLFPGLQQTVSGPYVLQPVLQWGSSEIGGGRYWTISNWYVNGQGSKAVQGPTPVRVEPGDVLQAVISLTAIDGAEFSYVSSFVGHPEIDAAVQNVAELAFACITLECYGANAEAPLVQCTDYPDAAATVFSNIELKTGPDAAAGVDVNVPWQASTVYDSCGQSCTVLPGVGVQLSYR